jgi:hypothetical protein
MGARRAATRFIQAAGAGIVLAVFALGCAGGTPEAASTASTPAVPSTLWLAQADGSIVAPAGEVLASELFLTRPANGGRQVAYDASHERLWYSDDHQNILSIDLTTGVAGPRLGPFSDVALWGCSVNGRARTFAIDEARNRLLVSALGGGLLAYDLDTLELSGGIGPSQLSEIEFDFRRLAVDGTADTLWYSTASGAVLELDLQRNLPTGRRIELPVSPRSIAIDEDAGTLLVIVDDGLLAIDLDTLVAGDEAAPTDAVALTWVAGR